MWALILRKSGKERRLLAGAADVEIIEWLGGDTYVARVLKSSGAVASLVTIDRRDLYAKRGPEAREFEAEVARFWGKR